MRGWVRPDLVGGFLRPCFEEWLLQGLLVPVCSVDVGVLLVVAVGPDRGFLAI